MPDVQTNTAALLAQSDRLTPEDLDLGARSRRTWLAVTGERRGPLMQLLVRTPLYWIIARFRSNKDHRSDPLEMLDRVIVLLASADFPEAQLRLIEQHVGDTITICKVGAAQRLPELIDLDEQEVEGIENNFQTARLSTLARGRVPDPATLDQEALHCRLEAGLSVEKARSLEREARSVRAGRKPRALATQGAT